MKRGLINFFVQAKTQYVSSMYVKRHFVASILSFKALKSNIPKWFLIMSDGTQHEEMQSFS